MPNKRHIAAKDPSSKVLIKNYGLLWKRDYVDWKNKHILGRKTSGNQDPKTGRVANFWKQSGIYVLYNDLVPVYIGQIGLKSEDTTKERFLGRRLHEHTSDQLGQKWNRFSWFGFKIAKATGDTNKINGLDVYELGTYKREKLVKAKDEVYLLEALLISIFAGNLQNKQDGGFSKTGVIRYAQLVDKEFISIALAANDPYSYGLLYDVKEELVTKKEFEDRFNKLNKTIEGLPTKIKNQLKTRQT